MRPSDPSFFRYQHACKHDILKTNESNEPTLMQIGTEHGHETINFGCQDIKAQGHTKPKMDFMVSFSILWVE